MALLENVNWYYLVGNINFSRNTNNSTKKLKSIRDYGVGAQILLDLGVKNMTILSNTKATAIGLDGFGLSIKSWKQVG